MAKHIIVGAGIGGLYTAKRLINEGVLPANILVIDPRIGIYTRPGHLNCDIFGSVSRNLGIDTDHTAAHHIKDLERKLYSALEADGVQFIKERFVDIQLQTKGLEKGVITRNHEGIASVYPADFVFDCTGKPAEVAQAVNRQLESKGLAKAFNRSALCESSPISHHLVAHVKVENYRLINDFSSKEILTVPHHVKTKPVEEQLALRQQLMAIGWTYEAFPSFYTFPQGSKDKLCLYMETPESLPKEQQSDWINLLLSIYSNGAINSFTELKPSTKYGSKPRIVGFQNELYVSDKVVYSASDCPTVVEGFDGLKGFDYRSANGVRSGIECCDVMISSLTISGGRITAIDSTRCEAEIFALLHGEYKDELAERQNKRHDSVIAATGYFSGLYEQALSALTDDSDGKETLYKKTVAELAYKALILKNAIPLVETINEYTYLNELNERLILLLRVRDYLRDQEGIDQFVSSQLPELTTRLSTAVLHFNRTQSTSTNAELLRLFTSLQTTLQRLGNSVLSMELNNKIEQVIRESNVAEVHRSSASSRPIFMISNGSIASIILGSNGAGRGPLGFFGMPNSSRMGLPLSASLDGASEFQALIYLSLLRDELDELEAGNTYDVRFN